MHGDYIFTRLRLLLDYFLPLLGNKSHIFASPCNILYEYQDDIEDDIDDITCPRVDINFNFDCSTRYLTKERSERVRYRV